MVQRGAVVNNQIEEQGKRDVLGERTAVFPVSADMVFRTPAATESRFAHDFSRVRAQVSVEAPGYERDTLPQQVVQRAFDQAVWAGQYTTPVLTSAVQRLHQPIVETSSGYGNIY